MNDFSPIPTRFHTSGKITSAAAISDILFGLRFSPLWLTLAWQEIKLKYRGSILGPFWLSLSMAATVIALGLVYGALFKKPLHEYLPYLVTGLMAWYFISTILGDACTCFTQSEGFIKKIRQPFSVYVYRTIYKNLIVLAHNFVIYIVVAALFGVWPWPSILLLLPALALLIWNSVWVCFLFGMVCARFRDVTQIVNSITQIVFFITPVFWHSDALNGGRSGVVAFNPFYHMVELIRAPLLGEYPPTMSWLVVTGIAVMGSLIAFFMFRKFRPRLAYWV